MHRHAPQLPVVQGAPLNWATDEDHLLCAIVNEFGVNWSLVSDVMSSTTALQAIWRRQEFCRTRFQQLSVMADGKTGSVRQEGHTQDAASIAQMITKGLAKELFAKHMPLSDQVLKRLQHVLTTLSSRVRTRKLQDKQLSWERSCVEAVSHFSHNKLIQQASALQENSPLLGLTVSQTCVNDHLAAALQPPVPSAYAIDSACIVLQDAHQVRGTAAKHASPQALSAGQGPCLPEAWPQESVSVSSGPCGVMAGKIQLRNEAASQVGIASLPLTGHSLPLRTVDDSHLKRAMCSTTSNSRDGLPTSCPH